jgi:hypothetical protein
VVYSDQDRWGTCGAELSHYFRIAVQVVAATSNLEAAFVSVRIKLIAEHKHQPTKSFRRKYLRALVQDVIYGQHRMFF